MLLVPQKGRIKVITNMGIVGTATPGTGVPCNATTLLDGDVTELIASAANVQDSWGIGLQIMVTGTTNADNAACMDILIGGATDDVLIPALIVGGAANNQCIRQYFFPLHIPQGKRIAATLAAVRTGFTSQVVVWLYGGSPSPFRVGRKVTTYGTQISNARGQAVTPTASGGAASVTEMTASSGANHFCFMPGFQVSDSTMNNRYYNIGIGVGAATEDRIGTWNYASNVNEVMWGPFPVFPAFIDVPSGSRLTLLASNDGTNDAAYEGLIYAVS